MILYEYPCNERVRAFLRVEYLFDRLHYFMAGDDPHLHQIAVTTLFEILDVCERSDLRGMILQDIERQRLALSALREHPGVSSKLLDNMLNELQEVTSPLAAQGRLGQNLKDNDWLGSLRGRLTVPGGCSQVDIPSYYAWQSRPVAQRRADLQSWSEAFQPMHAALMLVLRLLRDAGDALEHTAHEGNYQEMLGGKSFQLLRVWVDEAAGVFPEMSANKYVLWVRFALQDTTNKPVPLTRDIHFKLARCNIG
ncbi:cell division protein ZapD [Alcaligenaceae bacterium 429]|uniref:cell division protein ZapD n=1 Tax=Paenalcaligenes sp. Me52 TaxID=3392038 RepID=UPI001092A5C6|nr:cell division protein ZapD [Alcaligenaceae bacterium 429]